MYGTSNQGFSNQVVQLSPDAVAEFQVVTNNMSAEYGRSGGATINVVTRYGTNQLHGRAWEFVRNTDFDATGFFKPDVGRQTGAAPKPVRRYPGRSAEEGQALFLRRLRGLPPIQLLHRHGHPAHRGRARPLQHRRPPSATT